MSPIPGFAMGIVRVNNDPEGGGRIKVEVPGLITPHTPYWVMPFNWPARKVGEGAQYPPPERDEHVAVIWEYGEYLAADSHAMYLTGYYGRNPNGTSAGPAHLASAPTADAARKMAVLWEGSDLLAYVQEDTNLGIKKLVLQCKTSGTKIELNAADGPSGKAETIRIEARTSLCLYAKGLIDIQADGKVQIQGREVTDHRGRSRPRGI